MHEWMQNLLNLQEKDLRLAKIEAQVAGVPRDKAKATDELKADEALVAAAKEAVRTAEKAIKSAELDAEGLRTKMRDFQAKSAMIKNNEEYKAALHQADACRKQVAECEDREIKSMEELERAKRNLEQQEKRLAAARQRVAEIVTDLDTRQRNCQQEIDKLKQERQTFLSCIPADMLKRYDRLRQGRYRAEHRSFVPIRDGVCDGCHMNVTAQVRVNTIKGQLCSCGNCGRLLYVED
jgi:predicted  nucleic acid-binding Zn-ribbon protein